MWRRATPPLGTLSSSMVMAPVFCSRPSCRQRTPSSLEATVSPLGAWIRRSPSSSTVKPLWTTPHHVLHFCYHPKQLHVQGTRHTDSGKQHAPTRTRTPTTHVPQQQRDRLESLTLHQRHQPDPLLHTLPPSRLQHSCCGRQLTDGQHTPAMSLYEAQHRQLSRTDSRCPCSRPVLPHGHRACLRVLPTASVSQLPNRRASHHATSAPASNNVCRVGNNVERKQLNVSPSPSPPTGSQPHLVLRLVTSLVPLRPLPPLTRSHWRRERRQLPARPHKLSVPSVVLWVTCPHALHRIRPLFAPPLLLLRLLLAPLAP